MGTTASPISTIFLIVNCGLLVVSEHQKPSIERVENISKYPFLVSVTQRNTFICSGAILREDIVLTSAHCVCDPTNLGVIAGRTSSVRTDGAYIRKVSRVIPHKDYHCGSKRSYEYDMAVLVLEERLNFNRQVNAINLPKATSPLKFINKVATVAGWAHARFSQRACKHLLARNVVILSDRDCYDKSRGIFDLDDDGLCAVSSSKNGNGYCWGKSGSVLFIPSRADPEKYILLGLASTVFWNIDQCEIQFPSIFSSILYIIEFILEQLFSIDDDSMMSDETTNTTISATPSTTTTITTTETKPSSTTCRRRKKPVWRTTPWFTSTTVPSDLPTESTTEIGLAPVQ